MEMKDRIMVFIPVSYYCSPVMIGGAGMKFKIETMPISPYRFGNFEYLRKLIL